MNSFLLLSLDAPFCAKGSSSESTKQQHALAVNETVRLRCNVEANPTSNHYYWTLNDDSPHEQLLSESDSTNELTITATSSDSFGRSKLTFDIVNDCTLTGKVRCWAKNQIGMQREPCVFLVSKAGPPASLDGCLVTNKTTTSLNVECIPGDSGGSKQVKTFFFTRRKLWLKI